MSFPGPFPATGVGSLPHADPGKALRDVLARFPEIPYWPQLPRRSFLETMYAQFAAGLPGASFEGEKLFVEGGDAMLGAAERFYERFLSGGTEGFAVPADRAAGLAALLAAGPRPFPAVKGQITGPVSFGLMVTDRARRPLFYDPVGRDVLVKHLLRTAQWQAAALSELSPEVILVVDEPFLASVGSGVVALSRADVVAALDEIFEGLPGVRCGIHCCANTDWEIVLATKVRYLSFDAYAYADALLLFTDAVAAFLERGGKLALGIVPTDPAAIANETPASLAGRTEALLDAFAARGVSREALVRGCLVTPACGLGTVSVEEAERASALAAALSGVLRSRYGGAP